MKIPKLRWDRVSSALSFAIAASVVTLQVNAQSPRSPATQSDPSTALATAVRPFIQKNCQMCHSNNLPSGGVDLEQLLVAPNSLAERLDTWEDIAYQLRSGGMPPAGARKPTREDTETVLELISHAVAVTPMGSVPAIVQKEQPPTTDWLTFSYDPERTGWDRAETKITKATAPNLQLMWKLQTDTVPNPVNRYSTLTDPVVVDKVPTRTGVKKLVFVGSHDNSIYAIDAAKGSLVWTRNYPNVERAPVAASGICPNNMNATPVVDRERGILYFLPNDGKLRGVNLSDGKDRFPATRIVPPYSRNFSLNLSEGRIFTSTTRGCANAVSEVVGINVNESGHAISRFYTSTGKASGPWGRGGIVRTPFGWIFQTADGAYDPASGRWGSSVISLTKDGRITNSFTPPDQVKLDARDLELGSSSPVIFQFGGRTLAATAGKEGVIYLLDVKNLGGADHRTALYTSPRWSNDSMQFGMNGMWSVISTYVDAQGKRWLFAPFYGPASKTAAGLFKKTHGPTVNGELMAFTVEGTADHPTLQPQWMSADFDLPGVVVIANGVLLELASGDRGSTLVPRPSSGTPSGSPNTSPPMSTLPLGEVNPSLPGFERDQAWRASQLRPFADGGQKGGSRYSGGRDATHAVIYALDPSTGDEIYSSGDTIQGWNHYGGMALSDGTVYFTTWDAKVFSFGLTK